MKKTILVGIVAIAMLFAFTACEPQALDYPIAGDNDIANVIVTEAPKFYAGSTETTGYGTITVERVGGKTTTGVTAMFSVLSDSNKVLPGKNPVAVAFGGISGTTPNGTTWATTVDAIELESIVFESDYVEGTEISDAKDVGIKSVVGTYTDGTTISLLNNSSYSDGVSKSLDKENSTIVITAAAGVYSTEAVKATLSVKVAETEAPGISAVTVTYGDEDTEVIVGQSFEKSLVKVVATYGTDEDAENVTLTEGQYTLSIAKYTFAATDVENGVTLTAYVVDAPENSTSTSGNVTIPVVADYIDSFKADVAEDASTTKPYTFTAGTKISENLDKFVFTADSMAVATAVPEGLKTIDGDNITVNPAYDTIPTGFTGTFTTYFTLNADANSGHAVKDVRCTLTVVAPASEG